jgi:hypothetical protein
LNGTGLATETVIPFNATHNGSAFVESDYSKFTSNWNYSVAISTPPGFNSASNVTSELSLSWPEGQGPGVTNTGWAICVVYLPDIVDFGAGLYLKWFL